MKGQLHERSQALGFSGTRDRKNEKKSKKDFYKVTFKKHVTVGIVNMRVPMLSGLQVLPDGRDYRRTALPCGKESVVNISIFGKRKFLQKISSNSVITAKAVIMKKTIKKPGGNRSFYNLDLHLVHPKTEVDACIKVAQQISKGETGIVYNCPQGGAIVVS